MHVRLFRNRCGSFLRGRYLIAILLLSLIPAFAHAEVRLPAVFSDHMVLMRSANVPIWGWASAGERVSVRMGDALADATADATGHWRVHLDLLHATSAPQTVVVHGTNNIVIQDVLVGVVWLSSGQSNMELPLRGTANAPRAVAQSANNDIRFFRVERIGKPTPAEDCKGHWVVAGPDTAGEFSAIAYYFARDLQATLGGPVGILDNSWGGTISELWLSPDAMSSVDELRNGEAERIAQMGRFDVERTRFVHDFGRWLEQTNRQDLPTTDLSGFLSNDDRPAGWASANLPGAVADTPGVFWIRKVLNVSKHEAQSNLEFKVMIGPLEGFDQFYWNGTRLSDTPYTKYPGTGYPRYITIPRALMRDGKNVVTLRIYSPAVPPRLTALPENFWAGPIMLAGEWQVKAERVMPPLTPAQLAIVPHSPAQVPRGRASAVFNGVLAPLIPYALDGVIWYQGESDADRAWQYRTTFPLLIENWRQKWGRGDMPFLFVQLPRWGEKLTKPGESDWAELREAQTAALKLPRVYEAVLIDQGEAADLHPRQKQIVGERLANIALAEVYGKKRAHLSPTFAEAHFRDGKAEIRFANVNGALVAHDLPAAYDVKTVLGETAPLLPDVPGSELQGFAICGEDHRWVWADAKIIDRDKVLVWSDRVPQPVAVRYAWSDDPTVNLFDSSSLPAAPFRTDSFPAITLGKLYGPEN
jgi:sialate O-acetylesterase